MPRARARGDAEGIDDFVPVVVLWR